MKTNHARGFSARALERIAAALEAQNAPPAETPAPRP